MTTGHPWSGFSVSSLVHFHFSHGAVISVTCIQHIDLSFGVLGYWQGWGDGAGIVSYCIAHARHRLVNSSNYPIPACLTHMWQVKSWERVKSEKVNNYRCFVLFFCPPHTFFKKLYSMCICVCLPGYLCSFAWLVPLEARCPGTEIVDSWNLPCGCCESSLGPMKSRQRSYS